MKIHLVTTASPNRKDLETRTYEVSARAGYQLDLFEEFMSMVQYCGAVGASRSIQIFIDGDGGAQLKFKRTDSRDKLQEGEDVDALSEGDPIKMRGID